MDNDTLEAGPHTRRAALARQMLAASRSREYVLADLVCGNHLIERLKQAAQLSDASGDRLFRPDDANAAVQWFRAECLASMLHAVQRGMTPADIRAELDGLLAQLPTT